MAVTENRQLAIRALFAVSAFLLLLCALPNPAHAYASGAGDMIREVRITGNQRIEPETIQTYITLTPGTAFDEAKINDSLKNLFASGLFADVSITRQENALVVKVMENPMVSTVAFEGNKRIKTADLEAEAQMKARSVYSRAKVQSDVKRILELYRRNGRFSATCEPKIIQQDQNRVDLVYEINEGAVTKIKKVYFVGNTVFDDSKLTSVLKTKETRWYRFFSNDDKYDPDRVNVDQEALRRFYVEHGYADFQVKSAVAELSPEKDGFYITYTLDEGERYTFGKITIDSKLSEVPPASLQPLVQTKENDIFNATKMEESVDAIVKHLGDLGYAFIDVNPATERDPATHKIGLRYEISEGPRVYVERINIHGNVRTLDSVIRREFRLAEGDPYSTSKIQRSEQRLRNLGFFEDVKIKNVPGSAADKTDVDVEVSEKSTGELTVGGGFSTVDGVLAQVGVKENNLLGTGRQLRLNGTLATRRQDVDFGFTEPYFLDRDIAAGFDVFRTEQNLRTESSYDERNTGVVLRANYPLTENLRHGVNYTIRQDTISNIQPGASIYVEQQAGTEMTSSVGHNFIYDKRDNKYDPTTGYYFKFAQDVAGLGGDAHYLRNQADASWYHNFSKDWVFRVAGSGGYIAGFGEDVRIQDRFFIGSRELKGFSRAGIGPRDITTRDALGGNTYYTGELEQSFPLGLPDELGFLGVAFVNVGDLWNLDASGPNIIDQSSLRAAAGLGIAWKSPLGPIRLDYAIPFLKDTYDEEERFSFSFGTRF